MRAIQVTTSAEGIALEEANLPKPAPGPGELLIRVSAAGVTPTEMQWYPTSHDRKGGKRVNAVPGHEFSGVVEAVGKDISPAEVGQEVFGINDWFSDGATAEYCVALFTSLAPKPPRLTHVEAASVPIGALTAWQGLFDHARLVAGDRVLVHGGAGAVGVFAVQLARLQGSYVIATASTGNVDFVAKLGADEVIDYKEVAFEEKAAKVDVVFDTVGGETLERSWGLLKPNGRLVTIASVAESSTESRIKDAFFIVEPNRDQLIRLGDLLERGTITTVVDSIVPFTQSPDVYMGRIKRRGRGKVVVDVAA
jgi:NADPH:quinone reductase-like Zn-dependent oxidoreductase